ncbi:uncharacterized protein VP01_1810g3 [Puccinia sorghi]|uniref:DUF4219 domain-containing protein n=1 Tax=Puccinia sorghi TaxID=27349 RepID=A0A0L6VER0_9BASI|nr:uncharacterized protein VP01_1810g3 [Puccinia sorghi]
MDNNEGGSSNLNIPKVDDTNYLHWSMQMEAHLCHKGLTKYITETTEAINIKHAETVDTLMNYMSETTFKAIITPQNEENPYKIWSSILFIVKRPSATLTKLQEMMHLEESWKNRMPVVSKSNEKSSKEQSDAAAALMQHNPEATSHNSKNCWQLHPEQRPHPSQMIPPLAKLLLLSMLKSRTGMSLRYLSYSRKQQASRLC